MATEMKLISDNDNDDNDDDDNYNDLPLSVEKHLKLLSQYPQAMIVLLSLVTTKHEALGVTVWSRGSPSCLR